MVGMCVSRVAAITGEYRELSTYKIFTSTPSPVPVAIKSEFCVFIILVLYQFPPLPHNVFQCLKFTMIVVFCFNCSKSGKKGQHMKCDFHK